jgi:hypothetical protein
MILALGAEAQAAGEGLLGQAEGPRQALMGVSTRIQPFLRA